MNGNVDARPPGTGKARVVFMGTPSFAAPTLQALIAHHDVVAVYTQPDRPAGRGRRTRESVVKGLARSAGIPVRQPRSLRRDPDAARTVGAYRPDVVVVAAYGLILPQTVLTAAPGGAVNVHGSRLPRWRGAAPVQRAILAGDTETGVTIMLMDEGVDTGAVLAERSTPIGPAENAGELTERLASMGAELLIETLPAWLAGELVAVAQDDSGATYAPKLEAHERILDWRASALELEWRVRALAPTPGARLETSAGGMKVLAAHASPEESVAAGEVTLQEGVPRIGCGSGALVLDMVQPSGGKAMTGRAYCNGRPAFARERLPQAVPS